MNGIKKRKTFHTASRAFGLIAGAGNHNTRTAIAFYQAGSHNTGHPMEPVFPIHNQHTIQQKLRMSGELRFYLLHDFRFRCTALGIGKANIFCQAFGFVGIFTYQQANGSCRASHTAGGVDTRNQRKGDRRSRQAASHRTAFLKKRRKAAAFSVFQHSKPVTDKQAVFSGNRHHIANRSNGNQIGILFQHVLCVADSVFHGLNQLESYAAARIPFKRARAIGAIRVYHGNRCG